MQLAAVSQGRDASKNLTLRLKFEETGTSFIFPKHGDYSIGVLPGVFANVPASLTLQLFQSNKVSRIPQEDIRGPLILLRSLIRYGWNCHHFLQENPNIFKINKYRRLFEVSVLFLWNLLEYDFSTNGFKESLMLTWLAYCPKLLSSTLVRFSCLFLLQESGGHLSGMKKDQGLSMSSSQWSEQS